VVSVLTLPDHRPNLAHGAPCNGIDRLLGDRKRMAWLRAARVGLLTHDACHTAKGIPTRRALAAALGPGLVRLFTPEHGIAAAAPAGVGVADGHDPETGVQLASLYGPRLDPDVRMLADLDVIVVDLRDVGVRCFTYAATAARLIGAAARLTDGPAILVCDRPNPLGPATAGPPLDPALRSLVAWFDVPFVHGRTLGGLLALATTGQGAGRFETIPGDPVLRSPTISWVAPSPALDHPEAVALYPGLVLFEGTNLCEGRGTPLPFRSIAAPWLETAALSAEIAGWDMPIEATPSALTPAAGRYAGDNLPAIALSLSRNVAFDALAFGVRLLCAIAARHSEFAWLRRDDSAFAAPGSKGGYVIDWLMGSRCLREAMAHGDDAESILARWCAA
jgi:uncharacterized protein YbbC (DUF1343 family)